MQIESPLQYKLTGQNQTYGGNICNLSSSGILLETDHRLQIKQTLTLTITSHISSIDPLHAKVEILRVHPKNTSTYQVACKIIEMC